MYGISIVGCGYTGVRLAARWRALNYAVRGFATRPESLAQIAAVGADAKLLDLDRAADWVDFEGQIVYYCVPPAPAGERDERLERLLAAFQGIPRRFIYLSTTGVYGDRGGAAVDEDTPPRPQSQRAVRRLAAESLLRSVAEVRRFHWCILRVPGIYGPGRLPLERLRRGEPAIDPREAMPSNRIHVDDLATACVAAGLSIGASDRIYNVTDGTDDSLTSYLDRVARIANLPPPPLVTHEEASRTFSAASWSFLSESRRVGNRRMREELGVALAFHDLDAGIRASL